MLKRVDSEKEPTQIKWPFKRVMNRHLILQIDSFQYTGKLVIPDAAKRKPQTGHVVALADDIDDIQLGDKVLYSQFAGYALKFQGTPFCRCIGYDEILAVLNEDSPEIETEGA